MANTVIFFRFAFTTGEEALQPLNQLFDTYMKLTNIHCIVVNISVVPMDTFMSLPV